MKRLSFDQITRLCEDQGFIVRNTVDGAKVLSQDRSVPPYHFHRSLCGDNQNRGYENARSALRRIGVKFPEDVERERHRPRSAEPVITTESPKEITAMPPTHINGNANATPERVMPAADLPPIQRAKVALGKAMDALAELEQALNAVETDQAKVQRLRDAMRALGE